MSSSDLSQLSSQYIDTERLLEDFSEEHGCKEVCHNNFISFISFCVRVVYSTVLSFQVRVDSEESERRQVEEEHSIFKSSDIEVINFTRV